jgi:hypothetical protein
MSERGDAVAETPLAGPLPSNPVMVLVLVWYLLLAAANATLVMTIVPDRGHVVVTAEVIATGVGDGEQVVAGWPDHNGEPWETILTPRRPEEFPEGSTVMIRFDPEAREFAYTLNDSFYEASGHTERVVWAVVVLAFAAPLLLAWTWRLARWGFGALRSPRPATATVFIGTPTYGLTRQESIFLGRGWLGAGSGPEPRDPDGMWLLLRFPDGDGGFQRVIWNRHVVLRELREAATGPQVFASVDDAELEAVARPCPGGRRMYIVDIPGAGRIWPAGAARHKAPSLYRLQRVNPNRFNKKVRAAGVPLTVLAVGLILSIVFLGGGAPLVVAATVPVGLESFWLFRGAIPIRRGRLPA